MENTMKEIKRVELSKGLYITLYNNGICYLEIPGFEQIMVEQIKNTSAMLTGGKLKSPIILGTGKISIELTDAGTVRIPVLENVFTVAKISNIATKLKGEETLHLEYCPHCGSHAREQGVESHTSGFACNLCQKWIPFRSECGLVVEEVKPSEPVKILWFSRHQMTVEQYRDLERIYGTIDVSVIDMSIKHADDIKWDIENNDVLAVVAPPELLHEFVNYPGGRPVIVAKSERILVPSEDGAESKIEFKFAGWDLMEEYTIKTRRL